jgi:hypothetical protein
MESNNAYISKGIEMYFAPKTFDDSKLPTNLKTELNSLIAASSDWFEEGTLTSLGRLIPELQEIGDLGSGASAERDKIEITTLADDKHVYTDGLLADVEQDSIDFKFLYTPEAYATFINIINYERKLGAYGYRSIYSVAIPNKPSGASVFTIEGTTGIKLDGATYNGALTMTLTLTPKEEVGFKTVSA